MNVLCKRTVCAAMAMEEGRHWPRLVDDGTRNIIRWSQVGRLTGNMKSWCFDPRRQTSRHFYYDMTGSWELRGCKYQINILFYINSCLDVTLCWNNTCHKIENNSIQKLAWNFSTIRYNQIDPHNMTQLELQTIHRFHDQSEGLFLSWMKTPTSAFTLDTIN